MVDSGISPPKDPLKDPALQCCQGLQNAAETKCLLSVWSKHGGRKDALSRSCYNPFSALGPMGHCQGSHGGWEKSHLSSTLLLSKEKTSQLLGKTRGPAAPLMGGSEPAPPSWVTRLVLWLPESEAGSPARDPGLTGAPRAGIKLLREL